MQKLDSAFRPVAFLPTVCTCGIVTPKLKNQPGTPGSSQLPESDYCKSKFKTGVVLVGVFKYGVMNGETQTPVVEGKTGTQLRQHSQ